MGENYRTPGIIGYTPPFEETRETAEPLDSKNPQGPGGAAVVLNLFGDYPNDWSSVEAEIDHMLKKQWMPGIDDFAASMGLTKLVTVSNFSEFLGAIQQKPKASIVRINFVSHGDLGNIAMAGKVVSDTTQTNTRPPGTVTFANSLKSGDLVNTPLESAAQSVRDHFREGAEIFLYLCNAGINLGLMGEISKALNVKVRGFKDQIRYCPEFEIVNGKPKPSTLKRARVTLKSNCDSGGIEDRLTKLTPQSSFP